MEFWGTWRKVIWGADGLRLELWREADPGRAW